MLPESQWFILFVLRQHAGSVDKSQCESNQESFEHTSDNVPKREPVGVAE